MLIIILLLNIKYVRFNFFLIINEGLPPEPLLVLRFIYIKINGNSIDKIQVLVFI